MNLICFEVDIRNAQIRNLLRIASTQNQQTNSWSDLLPNALPAIS